MIALDTNILVQAHRTELEHHTQALRLLRSLAEGSDPWAIPWPCIYELIRVVTHPRVFAPPSRLDLLLEDLSSLFTARSLTLLGNGPGHAGHMDHMLRTGEAHGNLAFDAQIAALVREHGVSELWTLDRDFARFSGIRAVNPFADG